jgi:hypothetical protein
MQFSAYDQAILDRIVAENIDVSNTPYDPEWASSEKNLTVRTQFCNVGFNTFFSKQAFFEAYPSLRDYKQDFFDIAVEYGNEEVAIAMHNEGASVNGPPNCDRYDMPFAFTLRSQNHSMIRWMLSKPDLDPNVIVDDMNALSFAIEQSMPYDIIETMLQHGALNDPLGQWYPLTMAVDKNDHEIIQLLLFYGADPHYIDDEDHVRTNLDDDDDEDDDVEEDDDEDDDDEDDDDEDDEYEDDEDDEHIIASFAADNRVKHALLSWSQHTTQILRQMAGNQSANLRQNSQLWLEAVDFTDAINVVNTELNQGNDNIMT